MSVLAASAKVNHWSLRVLATLGQTLMLKKK